MLVLNIGMHTGKKVDLALIDNDDGPCSNPKDKSAAALGYMVRRRNYPRGSQELELRYQIKKVGDELKAKAKLLVSVADQPNVGSDDIVNFWNSTTESVINLHGTLTELKTTHCQIPFTYTNSYWQPMSRIRDEQTATDGECVHSSGSESTCLKVSLGLCCALTARADGLVGAGQRSGS